MSEQGTPTIELSDEPRRPATAPGPTGFASAGWRFETGCSSTGRRRGPRRRAPPTASIKVASGQKPSFAPRAGGAAAAARPAQARRGDGGDPAGAPPPARGATALRGPARAASRRSPRPPPAASSAAAARRPAPGARASRRRSACCRRRLRCAAPTCPPTTPSSTSRSAPTSRAVRPDARSPRSTSAAARTSSRRCSSSRSRASSSSSASSSPRAAPSAAPPGSPRVARRRAVRVVRAQPRLADRARRSPAGTEIQRLIATREPTPEQMEVGAAALDAILRAEGAPGPARAYFFFGWSAAPARSSSPVGGLDDGLVAALAAVELVPCRAASQDVVAWPAVE